MNKILVIFAALLAGAWAYNRYEPSYVRFESDESEDDYSEPMPYGFEYDVNDGQNNFGHRQQSDGQVTSGSYRVQLPDGRTQIVTYRADHNGYNAKVTYEQTNNHYTPAYHQQYNPSSSYAALPEPLFYRTRPSSTTTTTTTPAPVKPLPYRHFPLYEFPGIPPYHGPSNAYGTYDQLGNDRRPALPAIPSPSATASGYNKEDDSDEELPLVPLIFRTSNVDSYAGQSRSGYGKRSPIDIWSKADISAALDAITPAAAVEEEVIPAATDPVPVEEVSSTTEVIVPDDQVESQTDPAAGISDDEEIDFDILPFPLPLPLAFRPDAV